MRLIEMPRYYFSLANGRRFDDVDGLELPDMAAVRAEAVGFARFDALGSGAARLVSLVRSCDGR
jgi:hypothetical protein